MDHIYFMHNIQKSRKIILVAIVFLLIFIFAHFARTVKGNTLLEFTPLADSIVVVRADQEREMTLTDEEATELYELLGDATFTRTHAKIFPTTSTDRYYLSIINNNDQASCYIKVYGREAIIVEYVFLDKPQEEYRYYVKDTLWLDYISALPALSSMRLR